MKKIVTALPHMALSAFMLTATTSAKAQAPSLKSIEDLDGVIITANPKKYRYNTKDKSKFDFQNVIRMKDIPINILHEYHGPYSGHHVMYAEGSAVVSRTFSAAAAVDLEISKGRHNGFPNLASCMAEAIGANSTNQAITSSMTCTSTDGSIGISMDCKFLHAEVQSQHQTEYMFGNNVSGCQFNLLFRRPQ